jgi:hypothetical protein
MREIGFHDAGSSRRLSRRVSETFSIDMDESGSNLDDSDVVETSSVIRQLQDHIIRLFCPKKTDRDVLDRIVERTGQNPVAEDGTIGVDSALDTRDCDTNMLKF